MFHIIEMIVHASFHETKPGTTGKNGQEQSQPVTAEKLDKLEVRITESVTRKVLATIERQKER